VQLTPSFGSRLAAPWQLKLIFIQEETKRGKVSKTIETENTPKSKVTEVKLRQIAANVSSS